MYCSKCKYYKCGAMENSCDIVEAYNFRAYTSDNPCTAIDDDYKAIEDCEPLGLVKGQEKIIEI